jgi:mannosyltransferase OCH1-like enzyme
MKWFLDDKIKKAIKDNVSTLIPNNFDWKYYLEQNRDLVASGIENEETAIEHFVLFGKKENRLFSRPNLIKKDNKKEDTSYLKDLSDINKKILIKIPTLRRPQQLIESIDSFLENAHNKENIYFVVTIDINDEITNNNKIIEQLNSYKNLTICKANTESKIDAYNLHIDPVQFDILILSSDDMMVVQKSYDQIIIDTMTKYFPDLDGVLWFDTADTKRTNTLAIIGKKLYDQIKPLYKYCYTGYYCDDEFGQIAMKLGKMIRIDRTLIKHKVPDHLSMSDDSTYLKSLSYAIKDKTVYKIRKKIQFDIPGAEKPIKQHNIPKTFIETKRNKTWPNFWLVPESRYDDQISSMDLYVLEDMDLSVSKMKKEKFVEFAKNYFRDFRWTIPPIIHQIWMGGPIPPPIKEMMETFSVDYVKKYPGSRYILWDENKLKNFQMINRDLFDQENKYDCKSDIARVEILNKFGGVYIDADTVWLGNKSILSAPSSYGITVAYEKDGIKIGDKYLNNETKRCANGVFGSTIQNPIVAFIIGQMRQSYKDNRKHGVVASTGPDFIQSLFDSLKPNLNINIQNHKYFYPCWWCVDPKNNPNYKEFLETKNMSNEQISKKYPEAILFHKGFTSAVDGIEQ